MNYIDTDVLIHSLINQNPNLHLKINDIIEEMVRGQTFLVSWLSIQELGFVLAKLDHPTSFITSKLNDLISTPPVQYGPDEFKRAMELASSIGFKDFNYIIVRSSCGDYVNITIHFWTCQILD